MSQGKINLQKVLEEGVYKDESTKELRFTQECLNILQSNFQAKVGANSISYSLKGYEKVCDVITLHRAFYAFKQLNEGSDAMVYVQDTQYNAITVEIDIMDLCLDNKDSWRTEIESRLKQVGVDVTNRKNVIIPTEFTEHDKEIKFNNTNAMSNNEEFLAILIPIMMKLKEKKVMVDSNINPSVFLRREYVQKLMRVVRTYKEKQLKKGLLASLLKAVLGYNTHSNCMYLSTYYDGGTFINESQDISKCIMPARLHFDRNELTITHFEPLVSKDTTYNILSLEQKVTSDVEKIWLENLLTLPILIPAFELDDFIHPKLSINEGFPKELLYSHYLTYK